MIQKRVVINIHGEVDRALRLVHQILKSGKVPNTKVDGKDIEHPCRCTVYKGNPDIGVLCRPGRSGDRLFFDIHDLDSSSDEAGSNQ